MRLDTQASSSERVLKLFLTLVALFSLDCREIIHNVVHLESQNYDLVWFHVSSSNQTIIGLSNNMPTEDLYQIALLIDQLRHEDLLLRVAASRSLSRIAQCLGPERTRDELVLSTILHQLNC